MARYFGVPLRNGLPIGLGSTIAINRAVRQALPPPSGDALLQEDGTSYFELQDGTGYILLEGLMPTLWLDFENSTSLDSRITFSRGSQATLFDSTGTLRYAKQNLLVRSQEFDQWTASNVTVSANSTAAPDGTITADEVNDGTTAGVSHRLLTPVTVAFSSGLSYVLSVFVKNVDQNFVQLAFGSTAFGANAFANFDVSTGVVGTVGASATATITALPNNWYRCTVSATATAAASDSAFFAVVSSSTAIRNETYTGSNKKLYLWGAQLNLANMEGGVTSSLTTYYPTTTAAYYAPRFDYNPSTLQPRGLLIEEQRTNSIRNNTGVGAVVGNPGTDPTSWAVSPSGAGVTKEIVATGTENGIAYVDIRYSGTPSSGTNVSISFEGTNNIVASSGQTWTESVFVKLQAGAFTNTTTTLSLLGTNGTSGTESFASSTITSTPSDLRNCRLSVTGTLANAGTTHIQPRVRIGYTIGAAFDITLRIGLPQLEQGAFATSVIPTTTTALTRNADVASMTGTNFSSWYNQSEGTFVGYATTLKASAVAAPILIAQVSGGNDRHQMAVYTQTVATVVGGAVQVAMGANTNATARTAYAYKLNDYATSTNGGAVVTDTSATVPTVNYLSIGKFDFGGGESLSGHIQRISYYPVRLVGTTLQALTL